MNMADQMHQQAHAQAHAQAQTQAQQDHATAQQLAQQSSVMRDSSEDSSWFSNPWIKWGAVAAGTAAVGYLAYKYFKSDDDADLASDLFSDD